MSNQNYSSNYNRNGTPKYVSGYQNTDNYDVEQPMRRRAPQDQPDPYYGNRGDQAPRRANQPQHGQQYSQQRQQYPQDRYVGRSGYYNYGDNYDAHGYDRRSYDNRRYDDRYDDFDSRRPVQQNRRYDDYGYDYPYAQKQKKRTSGGVIVVRVIAIILLMVGLGIVGYKLYNYISDSKGHSTLQALSENFDQLYAMNNDFYGWLKVDDTEIDYPVMYSPYDPEHYLHTNFEGDYSESGELFMDANCDPYGYHALIYGHHMFNGSMFGNLPKYEAIDYLNSHRTFRFDTMTEQGEYEIFAVFYSQVYDDSEDVFKYYYYANLDDEWTYNNYVANVKALSIYDTGVTPVYGEKLVTLSTCNYHTEDGRFVVCARKIN